MSNRWKKLVAVALMASLLLTCISASALADTATFVLRVKPRPAATETPTTEDNKEDLPESETQQYFELEATVTDLPETDATDTDLPEVEEPKAEEPEAPATETDLPEEEVTEVPEATDTDQPEATDTDLPEEALPEATDTDLTEATDTDLPEVVEPEAEPEVEEPTKVEKPEAKAPAYEYQRNEDGSLVLNEDGDPVVILPEGATMKPVAFQRNVDGSLFLDENGDPVVTEEIPADAEKLATIHDKLNPNRTIDIYATYEGELLNVGDRITMYAVLRGYEGLSFTYQWQENRGGDWADIAGQTGSTYVFTLTEDNMDWQWRMKIVIHDVLDEGDTL